MTPQERKVRVEVIRQFVILENCGFGRPHPQEEYFEKIEFLLSEVDLLNKEISNTGPTDQYEGT